MDYKMVIKTKDLPMEISMEILTLEMPTVLLMVIKMKET